MLWTLVLQLLAPIYLIYSHIFSTFFKMWFDYYCTVQYICVCEGPFHFLTLEATISIGLHIKIFGWSNGTSAVIGVISHEALELSAAEIVRRLVCVWFDWRQPTGQVVPWTREGTLHLLKILKSVSWNSVCILTVIFVNDIWLIKASCVSRCFTI